MSQYFENDNMVKSERKLIFFNIFGRKFSCYTDNGVFAKDKFDFGTRLLLENINISNDRARVLDLGCGYGPVGIILKTVYPNMIIDMVDVNLRCIKLSKDNIRINKIDCNVFASNAYSEVDRKYDYIITNPPIRAGKDVIREFIFGSLEKLNEDGELWFVMRKDHGVKSILKEMEDCFSTDIVVKDKGFYVVKAARKK
jgi:16S rRNA (guanine1207-N2)-methyltransferase